MCVCINKCSQNSVTQDKEALQNIIVLFFIFYFFIFILAFGVKGMKGEIKKKRNKKKEAKLFTRRNTHSGRIKK